MPEFIDADVVTNLLRRVNIAGQPQPIEIQKTPAFCASEGEKALRIQD